MSHIFFLWNAKKMIKLFFFLSFSILLLKLQPAYAKSSHYYLCGSDEDGCLPGREQFCMCIPINIKPEQAYCLDLDKMTCKPAIEQPDCDSEMIEQNQASCLATMLQSEPNPPCKKVTDDFCHKHSIYMCNEDGNPNSCKKAV